MSPDRHTEGTFHTPGIFSYMFGSAVPTASQDLCSMLIHVCVCIGKAVTKLAGSKQRGDRKLVRKREQSLPVLFPCRVFILTK